MRAFVLLLVLIVGLGAFWLLRTGRLAPWEAGTGRADAQTEPESGAPSEATRTEKDSSPDNVAALLDYLDEVSDLQVELSRQVTAIEQDLAPIIQERDEIATRRAALAEERRDWEEALRRARELIEGKAAGERVGIDEFQYTVAEIRQDIEARTGTVQELAREEQELERRLSELTKRAEPLLATLEMLRQKADGLADRQRQLREQLAQVRRIRKVEQAIDLDRQVSDTLKKVDDALSNLSVRLRAVELETRDLRPTGGIRFSEGGH